MYIVAAKTIVGRALYLSGLFLLLWSIHHGDFMIPALAPLFIPSEWLTSKIVKGSSTGPRVRNWYAIHLVDKGSRIVSRKISLWPWHKDEEVELLAVGNSNYVLQCGNRVHNVSKGDLQATRILQMLQERGKTGSYIENLPFDYAVLRDEAYARGDHKGLRTMLSEHGITTSNERRLLLTCYMVEKDLTFSQLIQEGNWRERKLLLRESAPPTNKAELLHPTEEATVGSLGNGTELSPPSLDSNDAVQQRVSTGN